MMNKNDCRKIANWMFTNSDGTRVSGEIAEVTDVDFDDVNRFIDKVYMMIDELPDEPKPCPFCGSDDGVAYVHVSGNDSGAIAKCNTCGARSSKALLKDGCWSLAEQEALELWNTRAGEEQHE